LLVRLAQQSVICIVVQLTAYLHIVMLYQKDLLFIIAVIIAVIIIIIIAVAVVLFPARAPQALTHAAQLHRMWLA
jgi:heme/copper-type cytochrome/quinol oxidase subunit 4